MNSIVATIITFAIALAFLRLMDFLAQRGWVEPRLSRKLIHIGTGPIFVLCWLMFPDKPEVRWLAALVPLMIVLQFVLVGLGIVKDESAVQAMSRTGNPRNPARSVVLWDCLCDPDHPLLEKLARRHDLSDADVRRRWFG